MCFKRNTSQKMNTLRSNKCLPRNDILGNKSHTEKVSGSTECCTSEIVPLFYHVNEIV